MQVHVVTVVIATKIIKWSGTRGWPAIKSVTRPRISRAELTFPKSPDSPYVHGQRVEEFHKEVRVDEWWPVDEELVVVRFDVPSSHCTGEFRLDGSGDEFLKIEGWQGRWAGCECHLNGMSIHSMKKMFAMKKIW
jgi:hypothetical protein